MSITDRIQLLSNGSLTIDDVRSADAGDYTCRAENEHGADEITVSLAVQGSVRLAYLFKVSSTESTLFIV